jgi:hypothetical protein
MDSRCFVNQPKRDLHKQVLPTLCLEVIDTLISYVKCFLSRPDTSAKTGPSLRRLSTILFQKLWFKVSLSLVIWLSRQVCATESELIVVGLHLSISCLRPCPKGLTASFWTHLFRSQRWCSLLSEYTFLPCWGPPLFVFVFYICN